MEKKLELSQLKNYLGTGLKCYGMGMVTEESEYDEKPIPIEYTFTGIFTDANDDKQAEVYDSEGNQESIVIEGDLFPIMYRLQDLDKFIPELGFVPLDYFIGDDPDLIMNAIQINDLSYLPFNLIQKLFEWHFWVFDQSYFEEGLIIDKLKQI